MLILCLLSSRVNFTCPSESKIAIWAAPRRRVVQTAVIRSHHIAPSELHWRWSFVAPEVDDDSAITSSSTSASCEFNLRFVLPVSIINEFNPEAQIWQTNRV